MWMWRRPDLAQLLPGCQGPGSRRIWIMDWCQAGSPLGRASRPSPLQQPATFSRRIPQL